MAKILTEANNPENPLFPSRGDAIMAAIEVIKRLETRTVLFSVEELNNESYIVGTKDSPEILSIQYGYDDSGKWGWYYDAIP